MSTRGKVSGISSDNPPVVYIINNYVHKNSCGINAEKHKSVCCFCFSAVDIKIIDEACILPASFLCGALWLRHTVYYTEYSVTGKTCICQSSVIDSDNYVTLLGQPCSTLCFLSSNKVFVPLNLCKLAFLKFYLFIFKRVKE